MTSADMFSMPLLLRTLFAPWKKDVIPTTGMPLQEKLNALGLNLVSVLVGFVVRVMVLFIGALLIGFTVLFGVVWLGVWAILPFLPIVFLMTGIVLALR